MKESYFNNIKFELLIKLVQISLFIVNLFGIIFNNWLYTIIICFPIYVYTLYQNIEVSNKMNKLLYENVTTKKNKEMMSSSVLKSVTETDRIKKTSSINSTISIESTNNKNNILNKNKKNNRIGGSDKDNKIIKLRKVIYENAIRSSILSSLYIILVSLSVVIPRDRNLIYQPDYFHFTEFLNRLSIPILSLCNLSTIYFPFRIFIINQQYDKSNQNNKFKTNNNNFTKKNHKIISSDNNDTQLTVNNLKSVNTSNNVTSIE